MGPTIFQVSYSAVPAVIIVRRDGDHTRITPIPLSWVLVWPLFAYWLSGLEFRWGGWAQLLWNRLRFLPRKPARTWRDFQSRLIASFYKIILGHVLAGISWSRSLAWGILGV